MKVFCEWTGCKHNENNICQKKYINLKSVPKGEMRDLLNCSDFEIPDAYDVYKTYCKYMYLYKITERYSDKDIEFNIGTTVVGTEIEDNGMIRTIGTNRRIPLNKVRKVGKFNLEEMEN